MSSGSNDSCSYDSHSYTQYLCSRSYTPTSQSKMAASSSGSGCGSSSYQVSDASSSCDLPIEEFDDDIVGTPTEGIKVEYHSGKYASDFSVVSTIILELEDISNLNPKEISLKIGDVKEIIKQLKKKRIVNVHDYLVKMKVKCRCTPDCKKKFRLSKIYDQLGKHEKKRLLKYAYFALYRLVRYRYKIYHYCFDCPVCLDRDTEVDHSILKPNTIHYLGEMLKPSNRQDKYEWLSNGDNVCYCKTCEHHFCRACSVPYDKEDSDYKRAIHDDYTCEEIAELIDRLGDDAEAIRNDYVSKNKKQKKHDEEYVKKNFMHCPSCKSFIFKDGGCSHITCTNRECKHEFCDRCGNDWRGHGGRHNCKPIVGWIRPS